MSDNGVLRVEQRWRYVCASCDATWLGLPKVVVVEGDGPPPPPEELAAAFGIHASGFVAGLGLVSLRHHDIVLETYWRVTPCA